MVGWRRSPLLLAFGRAGFPHVQTSLTTCKLKIEKQELHFRIPQLRPVRSLIVSLNHFFQLRALGTNLESMLEILKQVVYILDSN